MTNRLSQETSPYLKQHENNPVDWYPWGEEAFEKARQEDRPILLSIGYSTCHWCHVMAHESFENEEISALMNGWFVPIKLDREERPDVDAVYMSAVQAMTGSGGWPMTVFLTPDLCPFYGGTYYPPEDAFGRMGFRRLLHAIHNAWENKRDEVLTSATSLTDHLKQSSVREARNNDLSAEHATTTIENLRMRFDSHCGGFGEAPKFPAPTTLEFLLMHATRTGNQKALEMVTYTLEQMARGGIFDQLGGGFARYSVDSEWLVPHFEKMLYDNAQLARVYLHAYQITGSPLFRETTERTLDYLIREMLSKEGGFYSAQDADQEGIEGKFFVWTPQEFDELLGQDSDLLKRHYGVTPYGNFEDPHHREFGRRNVLSVQRSLQDLAEDFNVSIEVVQDKILQARKTLFEARNERAKPGTDDKILTSWNGLALAAFAEAGRVLGREDCLQVARQNASFLKNNLWNGDTLLHTYKNGQARISGLLEDHVLYGLGLIELFKATGEPDHLQTAQRLWDTVKAEHWDSETAAFYSTPATQRDLITRRQEFFDAAIISDNAAATLLALWIERYFQDQEARQIAEQVVSSSLGQMRSYATGFGGMWQAFEFLHSRHTELVVMGSPEERQPLEQVIAEFYLPTTALSPAASEWGLPVLEGRQANGMAYVCEDFACQLPARDPEALREQLKTLAG
ncbi:thioredoxin domain-containing protein [Deinococcus roseus]|uniref:Thioredoxin domain-containing protein n=1 Tax=Deinococcus roseus TaxID=392414 RepID=A0ABQ2CV07_9DEIO|nr:thioredoxin domain-containing protein [Deinococcus roseus]GGJ19809.1 thioredoxin domain-containing protein [Deinococcus roseus]